MEQQISELSNPLQSIENVEINLLGWSVWLNGIQKFSKPSLRYFSVQIYGYLVYRLKFCLWVYWPNFSYLGYIGIPMPPMTDPELNLCSSKWFLADFQQAYLQLQQEKTLHFKTFALSLVEVDFIIKQISISSCLTKVKSKSANHNSPTQPSKSTTLVFSWFPAFHFCRLIGMFTLSRIFFFC